MRAMSRHPLMRSAMVACACALVAGASAFTTTGPRGPAIDAPVADAAQRGDATTVKQLLDKRADVNVAQGDGMTALHWAALHGDLAMTNLLLAAKANVKAVTRIGAYTPLHIASKDGNAAVVHALLKAGADPNTPTASGATALHFAAASGSVGAVNELLDQHADPLHPLFQGSPTFF